MNKIILKKPIITEKSIAKAKLGFYTFAVDKDAGKETIKKAVEDQFGVNVVSIKTVKMPGKTRKVGKLRKEICTSSWKKAIVKLKKEQKIPIFEVGT